MRPSVRETGTGRCLALLASQSHGVSSLWTGRSALPCKNCAENQPSYPSDAGEDGQAERGKQSMISVSLRSFTDQPLVSTKDRCRQNSSRLSSYRTVPPVSVSAAGGCCTECPPVQGCFPHVFSEIGLAATNLSMPLDH